MSAHLTMPKQSVLTGRRLLPALRVWHCPFCVIFSSDDGTLNGNNSIEYALIRLDGETWKSGEYADNELVISREDFAGWGHWKECNRNGFESTISFERKGNKVVTSTKNNGIAIRNTTVVKDKKADIFVALTGDQCALTNINNIPRKKDGRTVASFSSYDRGKRSQDRRDDN